MTRQTRQQLLDRMLKRVPHPELVTDRPQQPQELITYQRALRAPDPHGRIETAWVEVQGRGHASAQFSITIYDTFSSR